MRIGFRISSQIISKQIFFIPLTIVDVERSFDKISEFYKFKKVMFVATQDMISQFKNIIK